MWTLAPQATHIMSQNPLRLPNADLLRFPDDDSNILTVESEDGSVLTKTTWTLLLYLTSATEGCRGGETVFFPNDRRLAREEIAVPPETGMLLLHKHGDDCMLVSSPAPEQHGSGTLSWPVTMRFH